VAAAQGPVVPPGAVWPAADSRIGLPIAGCCGGEFLGRRAGRGCLPV